jgi:hypothetical protein
LLCLVKLFSYLFDIRTAWHEIVFECPSHLETARSFPGPCRLPVSGRGYGGVHQGNMLDSYSPPKTLPMLNALQQDHKKIKMQICIKQSHISHKTLGYLGAISQPTVRDQY